MVYVPDPEEIISRALRFPGLQKRKKSAYPDLPPEEEKSVLSKALGTSISGLQYIGETLDKPGRAVRGLLNGKPGELANLIPFSDTMGITDPEKSTSGRDLLESYGMLGKNEPGLDWGDAAGFGAEVLTDPTSFMSFGAKAIGKAGKAAEAAGLSLKGSKRGLKLEDALQGATLDQLKAAARSAKAQGTRLRDIRGDQLGGVMGFTTGPLGLFGIHGSHVPEFAQSAGAFKALDTAVNLPETLTRAIPGVGNAIADTAGAAKTLLKGAFHAPSQGQFTKEGQKVAEQAYGAKKAAESVAKYDSLRAADAADEVAKAMHEVHGSTLGLDLAETSRATREAMQMAGEVNRSGGKPAMARALREKLPGASVSGPLRQRAAEAVTLMKNQQNKIYETGIEMGRDAKKMFEDEAQSPVGHMFRGLDTEKLGPKMRSSARQLGTDLGAATGRVPEIGHIPGTVVNDVLTDPALIGKSHKEVVEHLAANYSEHINRAAKSRGIQETQRATAKAGEKFAKKFEDMDALDQLKAFSKLGVSKADLSQMSPQDAAKLFDGLNNTARSGAVANAARVAQAEAKTAQQVTEELAKYVVARNAKQKMGPLPRVLVEDAVKNNAHYNVQGQIANANLASTHQYLHSQAVPLGTAGSVPLSEVFKNAGLVVPQAEAFFGKRFGKNAQQLAVPSEVAQGVTSFMSKSDKPEWMKQFGDVVDMLTQPFKRNVTLPFMSFLTRNVASGQWMNLASGEIPSTQHAMKYGEEIKAARDILADPSANKAILNEIHAHGVWDINHLESMSVNIGRGESSLPNALTGRGFLGNIKNGRSAAKEAVENSTVPHAKGLRSALGTPAAIGAEFNKQAEFMNRVPMYLYLRKHMGWTPEAAASKVRQLQVDYSDLAPFEKDVMKRLVPFYSWQRKIVPVMFEQMMQRPGGLTAQTVRASNTGRSENEFVPPYVGEGMSVKLGEDKYLSQLGLPTDSFADMFVKGPTALGTIKRTGQKALSQLNPLLKGPLETMTGQNFFTGQPIESSFPYPTKNVLANQVLHNTPMARAITTTRQLGDDRKDWLSKTVNLTTGAKITDVSGGLDKQQRIAEQKILSEMLREEPGIRSFTDVYPGKDKEGNPVELSDEGSKLYRAYKGLRRRQQKEGRDEKKKKKASSASQ